jgi:hypothetical protein
VDGTLKYSFQDPDTDGGWGGKLIFEYQVPYWHSTNTGATELKTKPRYLILGHLKNIVTEIDRPYKRGDIVGVIAEPALSGGWAPHLHVRCCAEFNPDVDGYSPKKEGLENEFPNPLYDIPFTQGSEAD